MRKHRTFYRIYLHHVIGERSDSVVKHCDCENIRNRFPQGGLFPPRGIVSPRGGCFPRGLLCRRAYEKIASFCVGCDVAAKQTFKNGESHVLWNYDLEKMTEFLAHFDLQHRRLGETTDEEHVANVCDTKQRPTVSIKASSHLRHSRHTHNTRYTSNKKQHVSSLS